MTKEPPTKTELTRGDIESLKEILAAFEKAEPAINRALLVEAIFGTKTSPVEETKKLYRAVYAYETQQGRENKFLQSFGTEQEAIRKSITKTSPAMATERTGATLTWTEKIGNLMKAADDMKPFFDRKDIFEYLGSGRRPNKILTLQYMRELYRASYDFAVETGDKEFLVKLGTEEEFMAQFSKQPYDEE